MRAKKSLGQHFLMHSATARRIVAVSHIDSSSTVLEVGPGEGRLTRELLAVAKKVIAVEADQQLITTLNTKFSEEVQKKKLVLVYGDIRTFSPNSIKGPYAVVANIPYYITGEIIREFLSASHKPFSMTILVQKEVAERIARSKKESLLSLAVKAYGTPHYTFTVPRGAFVPAPKVDSAVLSILSIGNTFRSKKAEGHFFEILKAGFAHKRKRLAGNLLTIAQKPKIIDAFLKLSLDDGVRAEDLPLATWRSLADALS